MADRKGEGSSGADPKDRSHMFSALKNMVSRKSKIKGSGSKPPENRVLNVQSPTHIKNDPELVEYKKQLLRTTAQSPTSIDYAASTGQAQAFSETITHSDRISVPPLSNAALEEIPVFEPISKPSDNAQEGPKTDLSSLGPIKELWNEAYDDLREKEEKLINDYEAAFSRNSGTQIFSTSSLTGPRTGREDMMARILKSKMEELNKNTWRLKFGSHEVAIKDLAQPVVGIINWANEYISGAVSANPYASIAWAGVSLLLPLILNPSKQAASLVKGLDEISDLIARSTMRENLYARRYESKSNKQDCKAFLPSHMIYRDKLKELYTRVLKFQAVSVCYYSNNGLLRFGLDIVTWANWDSLLADIQAQETAFGLVYDSLKDIRDQEEFEALYKRHEESMSIITSMGRDVSGLKKAIEDAQGDSRRLELLNWLSSIDPSENHRAALKKCKFDTGGWLLQSHEGFGQWKNEPHSLLWLHGKAGSGKSILCSSVIKSLENSFDSDPEIALAYFYFTFNDREKQQTDGMLCSLIKQLCCHRPDTPLSVDTLWKFREKGHHPDTNALEKALLATIRGFSAVYLLIDALDECPYEDDAQNRENLLDSLCRIYGAGCANLHILCTSRSEADIEAVLLPLISAPGAIDIDLEHSNYKACVTEDIDLYIDQVFATANYKDWPKDVKVEAKATLIEKAEGMFQYVACQLEVLRPLRTARMIKKALEGLPIGLDATYDRMLHAIRPEYRKQVASMLKWLSFSLRPLLLDELAEIFVLDYESGLPFYDDEKRLFNAEAVLEYMPSLVTTVPKKN